MSKKKMIVLAFLISVAFAASCCSGKAEHERRPDIPRKSIEQVLEEHADELMSVPGVVGFAQGLCNEKPCIMVFVKEKTGTIESRIPAQLEGYPVVIEETGEIRASP